MDDIQEILQADTEDSANDELDETIRALEAFLELPSDAREHVLEALRELAKEDADSTTESA